MDKKTLQKVALLARLHLQEDEIEPLRNDIQNILHYVEQLNQLDTDQVEPLAHPGDIVNALRKDLAQPSLTREELLKNSPKTDGEFYLVPAVLGEPGKS